jgi:hypothetical protein
VVHVDVEHTAENMTPYIGSDGRLYVPPANTIANQGWEVRDAAPKTAKLVETIGNWRLFVGRGGRQYAVALIDSI